MELEKRMYFFVIRQLNGLNAGIQIGHCCEQYAHNYANSPDYLDFVKNWRTWIVLDGGTTNSNPKQLGTLNDILLCFRENDIEHGYFHEPDLNNALTAVCFLADERVFDFGKYPDYETLCDDNDIADNPIYEDWVESMGGFNNVFLRGLIKGKRLASN